MPRLTVTFEDAECVKETALAILVVVDAVEYWIPKSQIDEDSEVWEEGHDGALVITQWFAEKEGLV